MPNTEWSFSPVPEIKRITEELLEANCYIIMEDSHCVIIDPGETEITPMFLSERALLPDYIFLTHEHCDHTAGLNLLRERYPEAVLHISKACSRGIMSRRLNMSSMMEVFLYFSGKPGVKYKPYSCEGGDSIFDGKSTLSWRGHCFTFVPLPGHSPGGTGIFMGEDIFFSGDYLLRDRETALRLPGGSEDDYEKITEPFLQNLIPGIHIYPGHGEDHILEEDDIRNMRTK